jgi:hypothetical protein
MPRAPAGPPVPAAPPASRPVGPPSDLASAPTPREVSCPNCGEPMLAGWGTTCGRCRPNLVAPKTLFLAPGQMAAAPSQVLASEGMTLGWLVVVSSVDSARRGALVELTYRRSILSRAGTMPPGTPGVVEFADTFMSSGHAVVTRPQTGNRNEAFEIRDRETAPSANGTFVNSRRLVAGEVMRLGDGDVVKVGATELVFRSLWLPGSGARPS